MRLRDLDLIGDMTLNQRIDDIRDSAALGRTVGNEWRVGDVMRWDWNKVSRCAGVITPHLPHVFSLSPSVF